MEEYAAIKQRYGIIGNNSELNRAIDVAMQVASTDLSVLITGESGVGKEMFPRIIHGSSVRKHAKYIAVNCGAIPEGTIDSELFGHEKGAFTGALSDRKGYFEVTDGGTIFLDEIGELPLATQSRLLRVLESGEFIRVGSSKVQKTDVRVIAATNLDIPEAVKKGKFREDLYYRLNTIPIHIPPLRERSEDIPLLFRKFASDFAEKYTIPVVRLTDSATELLSSYRWPGNVRQLKNITEQISIIEKSRKIDKDNLQKYLPATSSMLPMSVTNTSNSSEASFSSEREILYKVLFDMKKDMNELKKLVYDLMENDKKDMDKNINSLANIQKEETAIVLRDMYNRNKSELSSKHKKSSVKYDADNEHIQDAEPEESFSIEEKERELIMKALEKNNGKRKLAAQDLGISERTLYRKIKDLIKK